MKTLYFVNRATNTLYIGSRKVPEGPTNLTIGPKTEVEIDKAIRAAEQVVEMNPRMISTVSVPISKAPLCPYGSDLHIRVDAANNLGNIDSYVSIGYEGESGWVPFINRTQLPDVWFSHTFMNAYFGASNEYKRKPVVLEEHREALIDQFILNREKYLEMAEREKPDQGRESNLAREIAFQKGLLSICKDVREGNLPFETISQVHSAHNKIHEHDEHQNQNLMKEKR